VLRTIKIYVTLAGIVAVLFVAGVIRFPGDTGERGRLVSVAVLWTPATPPIMVEIIVMSSLRPDPLHHGKETVSPFARSYPAKSGERFEVMAYLKAGTGVKFLGCSLKVDGADVTDDKQNPAIGDRVGAWVIAN